MYSVRVHKATVVVVHTQHGSECWKMMIRDVNKHMK
jgi:hypothetical protein